MDDSEYTRRQYHSSSIDSLKATDNSGLPYDFVRFLAAVERFHVPILHITWQNHRKELGSGATSEIREARTSLKHSFAFKRIPDIEKREKRKETIYQQLITEMSILRHPAFRRHPNIVELQGICWDIGRIQTQHKIIKGPGISGGFSVWPTLVFETSEYGDLYRFSTSSIGRSLDVNQRLNICVAIGHTIAEMMSYRLAHGDIKPQNILIFKNEQRFYPKVADFGFSVSHLHPNTGLCLPCSKPWVAPEQSKSPEFTFSEVLQADIYSFGVLCFWMLFERQLSGVIALPNLAHWQNKLSSEVKHPSIDLVSHLKDQKVLIATSKVMVQEDTNIDTITKERLVTFFEKCLDLDPLLRPHGMLDAVNLLTSEGFNPSIQILPTNTSHPIGHDLKLASYINVLYECDYRVREHVYTELTESYSNHPEKLTCAYLLVCQRLKFGCREDDVSQPVAILDDGVRVEVEDQLKRIRDPIGSWSHGNAAHAYRRAAREGLHAPGKLVEKYRHDGVIGVAEVVTRSELKGVVDTLGFESPIALTLRSSLASLLMGQNRWQDAYKLQVQVIEDLKRVFGHMHIETLGGRATLCSIYQNMGRWIDAVDLQSKLVEQLSEKFSETHAETLACTQSLVKSNMELQRWDEAERRQVKVVEIYTETLGVEDGTTMYAMETLAEIYCQQMEWQQAEELAIEVIDASRRAYGSDHPSTLIALGGLISTYREQGRWDQVEKLLLRNSETCKRDFGHEHPTTLALFTWLAGCYRETGRVLDGIKLLESVIKDSGKDLDTYDYRLLEQRRIFKRKEDLAKIYLEQGNVEQARTLLLGLLVECEDTMGSQDLTTLSVMTLLAKVHFRQSNYDEALEVQSTIGRVTRELFGSIHPYTSNAMMNIASVYVKQDQFGDAESLLEETLGDLTQVLGKLHPDTLLCMLNLAETYSQHGRLDEADRIVYSFAQLQAEKRHLTTSEAESTDGSLLIVGEEHFDPICHEASGGCLNEVTLDMLLDATKYATTVVLAGLLRISSGSVELDPEVTEAVTENEDIGDQMLICLIERYGNAVGITSDVLELIFLNEKNGTAIMETLLERCHNGMRVTRELLEHAAESRSAGMMASLLKRKETGLKVTSKMLQKAASNTYLGDETVSALITDLQPNFQISTSTLVDAASNTGLGHTIMEILLSYHNCKVAIGEKVLMAAAKNIWKGAEVMTVLLERRGHEFLITERLLKTTVTNSISGVKILELFFEVRGGEVKITENILLCLVRRTWRTFDIMQLLLERRRTEIVITENVLVEIVRNEFTGEGMMDLLMEMCKECIVVTPKLLAVIATNKECGSGIRAALKDKLS